MKPILFQRAMAVAIYEDRKTQTRRIIDPQPEEDNGTLWWKNDGISRDDTGLAPHGQGGDALGIKQTFWVWGYWHDDNLGSHGKPKMRWVDCTDEQHPIVFDALVYPWAPMPKIERTEVGYHRRPSIFLPKEAWSKVWIKSVKVERLQAISREDAIAEGIGQLLGDGPDRWTHRCSVNDIEKGPIETFATPADAYRHLWITINGPESWDSNPWVWAYTFERI